jgi:hypothetical protein
MGAPGLDFETWDDSYSNGHDTSLTLQWVRGQVLRSWYTLWISTPNRKGPTIVGPFLYAEIPGA